MGIYNTPRVLVQRDQPPKKAFLPKSDYTDLPNIKKNKMLPRYTSEQEKLVPRVRLEQNYGLEGSSTEAARKFTKSAGEQTNPRKACGWVREIILSPR